ncbi:MULTISPECIES: hypothetical protein [Haloferax]|uniref:Uncharacterized protein n=1 Tax=Haloferax marinum TaxID=2666143 RepID=A0A6A8G2P5_9EURY|nr:MULTISPECIES: hypothetical protein [Haloferax]KAB1195990.1 hypothetical protein Hfx1150_00040 [Haloferax sp. CBA1150]MRW94965.1 hypothetical protein [Haloferax marinum]
MTEKPTPETDDRLKIDRRTMLKGGAAGLGLLALGGMGAGSAVASNGADKIYVGGSVFEEHSLDTKTDGKTSSGPFTLLSGSIKTSTPTDLILMVQVESALWTNIKTTGKDTESQAKAGLTCWIEIDGTPVPVSDDYMVDSPYNPVYGDRQAASEVVFNKRDFKVEQNFLGALEELTEEDVEYYLSLFMETRSSHGFNWVALNIDSEYFPANDGKFHDIELKGRLDVYRDDNNAYAKAVVGPRTMIGFPAKLANDASI